MYVLLSVLHKLQIFSDAYMNLLMKNIQLDKMAVSRRYTAEEAAELLAFKNLQKTFSVCVS